MSRSFAISHIDTKTAKNNGWLHLRHRLGHPRSSSSLLHPLRRPCAADSRSSRRVSPCFDSILFTWLTIQPPKLLACSQQVLRPASSPSCCFRPGRSLLPPTTPILRNAPLEVECRHRKSIRYGPHSRFGQCRWRVSREQRELDEEAGFRSGQG